MSPDTAQLWSEIFDEVGEEQWPALLAWVETGCYVACGDTLPSTSDLGKGTVVAGTRSRTTRHSSLRTSA